MRRHTSDSTEDVRVFAQSVCGYQSSTTAADSKRVLVVLVCRVVAVDKWLHLLDDESQIVVAVGVDGDNPCKRLDDAVHIWGVGRVDAVVDHFALFEVVLYVLGTILADAVLNRINAHDDAWLDGFALYQGVYGLIDAPLLVVPHYVAVKERIAVLHIHNVVFFLWVVVARSPHPDGTALYKF